MRVSSAAREVGVAAAQLFRTAVVVALACVAFPVDAASQTSPDSGAGVATACDGSYCVVGGTTTLTLSDEWRRKAAAAGVRLAAAAPASRNGNVFTFPVARRAAAADGHIYQGQRSAWYIEGCDVVRGGGLFHRGGAAIVTRGSRRAVRVLIQGPNLRLEVPEPAFWRGARPRPFALVLGFASWDVRQVTPGGFRVEAQLRVATGLTKGVRVPGGIAGSLALDLRVSPRIADLEANPTCAGGPSSELPRVNGGLLYPLLAGSVGYRTPLSELYATIGRGPNCSGLECGWRSGVDSVAPGVVLPVDGRTGVQLLLRSFQLDSEDPARSRLREWRSPEGVHIGSSVAELRSAYPNSRYSCSFGSCGLGFRTPPYRVVVAGRETRQRFDVGFGLDEGKPSVQTINVELHGEEGTCWVNWLHEADRHMVFDATCFGPLVAASLEPVEASPRFAPDFQPGGQPTSAVDDAGVEHYIFHADLVRGRAAPDRIEWHVECTSLLFPSCAPGRGVGEETWPPGMFEEWDLSFSGYSVEPPPRKAPGAGPAIPPLRFVAEFLDRPPFTIVISRDY